MIVRSVLWLLAGLWLFSAVPASANTAEAEALVKRVTEEVLSILREDKQIRDGDRKRAAELIENRIAPHFDFERMTALAVGRAWRQAEPAQREALIREFRELLVRTYSNALTNYRDQTVAFRPARPGNDADEAIVRSVVEQPGVAPVPIEYRLARQDGEWKVYDVAVNNVSLVTSYRGSFATELSSGGIEGLLEALQEKNRSVARKGAS